MATLEIKYRKRICMAFDDKTFSICSGGYSYEHECPRGCVFENGKKTIPHTGCSDIYEKESIAYFGNVEFEINQVLNRCKGEGVIKISKDTITSYKGNIPLDMVDYIKIDGKQIYPTDN